MEELTFNLDHQQQILNSDVTDLTQAVFIKSTKPEGSKKYVNQKNSIFYDFMDEAS